MKINQRLCSFFYILLMSYCINTPAETVNFDGTLIEDACEVFPGDENIELDFGTIVDKYLYLNTRTHSQPFTIRLINCDLALGREVKVKFTGTENSALPGLLAIDSASLATGIAVGLEKSDGTPLPINTGQYTQQLHTGNGNNLNLKAYVQGEPMHILNKSIGRGSFIAIATFALEYE